MNEEFAKAVKDCIIPILSRFTNGITELNVKEKMSFNNSLYYKVRTNDIPMTPCMFKSLRIEGEGTKGKIDDTEVILWRLDWRWECFDGGENGTDLITVETYADLHYGQMVVKSINIR